jgi:hypothetical protein
MVYLRTFGIHQIEREFLEIKIGLIGVAASIK